MKNIYAFTNNIPQKDGGTHVSSFRSALTRTINNFINQEYKNKNAFNITGEDIREGLTSVISIKLPDPKFSSQTKTKLVSSEIKTILDSLISKEIFDFLLENPKETKKIIEKIINAARSREAAKKAKEIIRKKSTLNIIDLPGKLANCHISDIKKNEIFLVEGDSAGGSAKQARDRKFQAILPLKGKILNVEKSNFEKIISSNEIRTLITALGCGIDKDYNIDNIKYGKIIIMTDADIDGSHIRTLLLTFFFRYMPNIIEKGHIFIAQPPLYRLKKGRVIQYIKDEYYLNYHLLSLGIESLPLNIIKNDNIITNSIEKKNILKKICEKYLFVINYFNKKLDNNFPINLKNSIIKSLFLQNYMYDEKNIKSWLKKLDFDFNTQNNNMYSINSSFIKQDNWFITIIYFFYGISKRYYIDYTFFINKDFEKILFYIKEIFLLFKEYIFFDMHNKKFSSVNELFDFIITNSKKGLYIQRYKGLGEMNPEQLWDTTMNPKNRNLIKINISTYEESNNICSILMSNNVQPRRKFIEKNANLIDIDI